MLKACADHNALSTTKGSTLPLASLSATRSVMPAQTILKKIGYRRRRLPDALPTSARRDKDNMYRLDPLITTELNHERICARINRQNEASITP